MALDAFFSGIELVFAWPTIGLVFFGVLLGIIIGSIPGVGAPIGMAMLLPLTVGMEPHNAIIFLIGIYSGGMYGGSIASILINAPGDAGNAATTLDGYPLTKAGRAKDALAISATASALMGFLGALVVIVLTPVLIPIVRSFGSPEYFLVAVLGIALITVVTKGAPIKGIVAGAFGFMISTVGLAIMTPTPRFTFDQMGLYDGIDFIAILIGLFAVAEMIKLSQQQQIAGSNVTVTGNIKTGVKSVIDHPVLTTKSGLLGLFIGMIPGAGATTSTFVSYAEAVRTYTDGKFGDGDLRGVIATESANNPTVSGSLVPTIAFGIPGSGSTAVLLGGLILHGLRPGPDMFASQLHVTYSFFIAIFIGNLLILAVGLLLITRFSLITQIDSSIIIPIVIVLSVLGAFTLNRNWFDVAAILAFGIMGYYMVRHNYSIIAFILGAVLGPIAEENLFRSLQLEDNWLIFVTRPLSLLLVILTLLVLLGPILKEYLHSAEEDGDEAMDQNLSEE
ncbi:tripartite tricarboxylate transporter permease [Natronococcus occultus]|uniref:DUF112 domain-containing protein n=1 Tax=Natronococcus occultus SP4 TaxID=694430 RepID=L0JWC8_9EURY|nr:tripartite tricarboxylate transporter permease [Natronococcus occultus]AGB37081.1 hypothetical protein Natoc_1251 [Natronococcus occultus SP4]